MASEESAVVQDYEFQVGDRVRVINGNIWSENQVPVYKGDMGVVTSINAEYSKGISCFDGKRHNGHFVNIELDNGGILAGWYSCNYELVEQWVPVKSWEELKVGDIVRVERYCGAETGKGRDELIKFEGKTARVAAISHTQILKIGLDFTGNTAGLSTSRLNDLCSILNKRTGRWFDVQDYADTSKSNLDSVITLSKLVGEVAKGQVEKPKSKLAPLPPRISSAKRALVDCLHELVVAGFKYLARDLDGTLCVYKVQPRKDCGGKQWWVDKYEDCKVVSVAVSVDNGAMSEIAEIITKIMSGEL